MFDDPAARKFLKSLLFSGCPMPKLEKGKGKKRAASVPAASVATAMDHGVEEMVALPASSGSRQSINVQVPTAILRNLQTYLEYVHAVRAEDSQPAKDSVEPAHDHGVGRAPGHGPRCGTARAELCVLRLTTLMIFS